MTALFMLLIFVLFVAKGMDVECLSDVSSARLWLSERDLLDVNLQPAQIVRRAKLL